MVILNDAEKMVAPCGMNCSYCYVHLRNKKSCLGCRLSDEGKPEHCRQCKIKDCLHEKKLLFCSECTDYPCVKIKRLDKSYRLRYEESLIGNMEIIKNKGMEYYLKAEEKRLKCPECGGIVDFHHKQCTVCG